MKSRSSLAIAVSLLTVTACSHAPRIETTSSGHWPIAGSFGFGAPDMGGDARLRSQVSACLNAKGMTASSTPAYLVQLGLSDPPAGSRLVQPENAGAPDKRGPGKRRNESLSINISSVGDGREAYRVQATSHYRRPARRLPDTALADAACQAIGAPPAPARGS